MTGHEGSDHSTTGQRILRHGNWKPGKIGENISFGKNTGEDGNSVSPPIERSHSVVGG